MGTIWFSCILPEVILIFFFDLLKLGLGVKLGLLDEQHFPILTVTKYILMVH